MVHGRLMAPYTQRGTAERLTFAAVEPAVPKGLVLRANLTSGRDGMESQAKRESGEQLHIAPLLSTS